MVLRKLSLLNTVVPCSARDGSVRVGSPLIAMVLPSFQRTFPTEQGTVYTLGSEKFARL